MYQLQDGLYFILQGLIEGVLYFKGTKRFASEGEKLKTSDYLSRFSDILLESALPGFAAQARRFQDPGEPREEHIKGESLPKHRTVLFFLEVGENCCLEKFPRFLRFVTHPRSFPGPDCSRPHSLPASQPTRKQWLCWGPSNWGMETSLGLRALGLPFAHLRLSFPDIPREGARHQL